MRRMMKGRTIMSFAALVFMTGCVSRGASRRELDVLTNSPWKYEKAGFDDDDGSFDALDPRIAGNEKDNTIFFLKDGTGYSQFARRSKSGNPDSLPFIWALQNDSIIYFQDQYYKVRVLTPHRLEIYADQKFGNTSTRYTIVLKR
jgi:hypothetical protein